MNFFGNHGLALHPDAPMLFSRRGLLAGAFGIASARSSSVRAAPGWFDVHMHVVGGLLPQFGLAVDRAVAEMDSLGFIGFETPTDFRSICPPDCWR